MGEGGGNLDMNAILCKIASAAQNETETIVLVLKHVWRLGMFEKKMKNLRGGPTGGGVGANLGTYGVLKKTEHATSGGT